MKAGIHPQYYPDAKVTCSCGANFSVGATVKELQIEVCSQCHPFYTGKGKLVDTAGRVEKFEARRKAAQTRPMTGRKARQEKNRKRREARAKRLEEESKRAIAQQQ